MIMFCLSAEINMMCKRYFFIYNGREKIHPVSVFPAELTDRKLRDATVSYVVQCLTRISVWDPMKDNLNYSTVNDVRLPCHNSTRFKIQNLFSLRALRLNVNYNKR